MKATISKFLLLINLLPFIALGQTPVETQIKRVEQGLLPSVLIKGDPSWSIEERMKHWGVPGLSVAVVKELNPKNTRGAEMLKKLTANEQ